TLSLGIALSRPRAPASVARRHRSQALEADALHFSTDVWSSAVVILGLLGVWFSQRTGIAWLARGHAVAALLDAAPTGLLEAIARAAAGVDEVVGVSQVRVRRSGPKTFADVILQVARGLTLARQHAIAHAAQ